MDGSLWGLVIIVTLVGLFIFVRLAPVQGLKNLTSDHFQQELERSSNKVLIDVREPHEYKDGFIPGAVNIPLSQMKGRLGEISKKKEIFLYCRSGMRSKQAAQILKKNGFSDLTQLHGGILAWKGKLKK